MAKTITVGYRHGSSKPEVLMFDKQLSEHRDFVREIPDDSDWGLVEVWHSDSGLNKSRKFVATAKAETPKPKKL